jgi:hypothetical protein
LKQLKELSDLLGLWFACTSTGGLATPQYNQFEGLDLPVVSSSALGVLGENWHKIHDEIGQWQIFGKDL